MAVFSKGADPDALDKSADLRGYAAECATIRAAAGTAVAMLQGQCPEGRMHSATPA